MKRCPCKWADPSGQCPEEIWSGSKEHCIFHDPSPEKDVVFFNQELEQKLEKRDYNFRGYYFPESANFIGFLFLEDVHFREATFQKYAYFEGASFRKNADFERASFQKHVVFSGATFKKNAKFRGATFQESTTFWDTTFQEKADFWGATFQEKADFRGVSFQDANFCDSTFEKSIEFTPEHIEGLNLRYTQFFYRGSITADLRKTRFHRAYLENVAFIDCEWPERIYEEEHMKDEGIELTFKELETIYRDLKQNMQRHGNYSRAGKFYYREMEMRRKGATKIRERLGLKVYKFLTGYGERYWNTAAVSGFIILFFAFLYGMFDCLQYSIVNPCLYQEIVDVIYFSFVTFTTLGLGDITPLTTLGKLLICLEAVIGAFMIALFVVVFVRKMTR